MLNIDFDTTRWERLIEASLAWWSGDLDRPLMQFTLLGRDPGRPEPSLPDHRFTAFYDQSVSTEAILDRWEYDMSRKRFLGDSFPYVLPNYGAGVVAAFLGALLEPREEEQTCWFHPATKVAIPDLHPRYDADNRWLCWIRELTRAAVDRWGDMVQVSLTDLGGVLDIISTLVGAESLLEGIYDYPDEVQRLTWEVHELWWKYFDELESIIEPTCPGHTTACACLFSQDPFYIFQCDFAYMIGPDMFREFVLPEITASCKRVANSFYHLDGPGQLAHLDMLLSIPELKGIQWIPGDGNPDMRHWPQVYRKIREAGKLIQIVGGPEILDKVSEQLGSSRGILLTGIAHVESEAVACLKKYGAMQARSVRE